MKSALIGHTGFVGGNLHAQLPFDDLYNTANLETIGGREYDLVVSAGAPAVKWLANKEPEADKASIARLVAALDRVRARRFVLISTVDVYPRPIDVDECEPLDLAQPQAYGRHRAELEDWVSRRFPGATRVRLPGLFGEGLKKNVVFDFLNDNALDKIHQDGSFQFYDLADVGRDVMRALDAGLAAVNFATEPVTTREVAREVFGREFVNALPPPAPRYDFRTIHAAAFARSGPYLRSRGEVFAAMRAFVAAERARQGRR